MMPDSDRNVEQLRAGNDGLALWYLSDAGRTAKRLVPDVEVVSPFEPLNIGSLPPFLSHAGLHAQARETTLESMRRQANALLRLRNSGRAR